MEDGALINNRGSHFARCNDYPGNTKQSDNLSKDVVYNGP